MLCKAMAAEMHSWGAPAIGAYLSFAIIAFFGGVFGHRSDDFHPNEFFVRWKGEQTMTNSYLDSGRPTMQCCLLLLQIVILDEFVC